MLHDPPSVDLETERRKRGDCGDPATPIRFLHIGDVIKGIEGAQYLVKPYLKRDTVVVMFGDSGSYKTFIALHLGLCVAHGVSFYGQPTCQGAVYVIAGEGHGGIGRRLRAWLDDFGIAEPRNLFVSEIPARLIDEGNAQEIAAVLRAQIEQTDETPALIIIDTLSSNFGDGDESSNADVTRLLQNVNAWLRAPFKACVLIVHHVGHGDKSRERGAYAIRANADERIRVSEIGTQTLVMESQKVKDGASWLPVAFKARVVELDGVMDSEGTQETSLVLDRLTEVPKLPDMERLGKTQKEALDCLQVLYDEHRARLEKGNLDVSLAVVAIKDWKEALSRERDGNLSRQQFYNVKHQLEVRNLIRCDGIYVRLTNPFAPEQEA